jgi:general secretion pathway protein D
VTSPAGAAEPAAGGEVTAPQVTAAPDINAVVIKATAAEQEEFAALIKELDKPRDQVMLEVMLVSVRSSNQFNLGVELSGASLGTKNQTIGFTTFGVGTVDPATGKLGFAVRPPFGGNFGVFRSNEFSLVLNALKSVGDTRAASSPRILVQDNATAQIKQLNREPIVTISQGQTSTLSGFGGFAEAGTTLDVIPHVSRDDLLRLEYQVNLSAFDQRTPEQQAANLPPPVRQNSSTGVVRIPADYTVVLGGLTATNDQRIRQGVPFLADLPVVGELFASRTNARSNETLYIFIRPVLLRDPAYRDLRFLSENDVRRAKLSRRDFPENPIKSFSATPGPKNRGAR